MRSTIAVPRGVLLASLFMIVALVVPAIAAPLGPPAPDPYARIAFVARNDLPFDSLAVGPVAGAVGGVVAITSPKKLSVAAATILTEYEPDVVVIAGGIGAISQAVEDEIGDLGDWDVDRAAGSTRDETARELARLLDEYGLGRPAMLSTSSGQNVGDLYLGGTLTTENLQVTGTSNVAPMIWADTDFKNTYSYNDGTVLVHELSIDVPADGGALQMSTSAFVTNDVVEEGCFVNLLGVLDATDQSAALTDIVLTGGMDLDRKAPFDLNAPADEDLASAQGMMSAQSVIPISAGPHVLRIYYSGAGGSFDDMVRIRTTSLSAVWYPASSVGDVAFETIPTM